MPRRTRICRRTPSGGCCFARRTASILCAQVTDLYTQLQQARMSKRQLEHQVEKKESERQLIIGDRNRLRKVQRACPLTLPQIVVAPSAGGPQGGGLQFLAVFRNFAISRNFTQFPAFSPSPQLLFACPPRVRVGALCVPCAEVLLLEASGVGFGAP